MTSYVEVQWDGLIGPTHHYAGLSHGNVASETHALSVSHPRQAALQGLQKMQAVHRLGIPQYVVPPHPRPNRALLTALGFDGSFQQQLNAAWAKDPALVRAAWSASSMWVANMATVSPASDTADDALHLTPANLASTLHRRQEAEFSHYLLQRLFGDVAVVHPPLASGEALADEGAANHMRFAATHGDPGVEVFVYGRDDTDGAGDGPEHYPARQTRAACEAIIAAHQLPPEQAILVRQHPRAIDAGVFHNDVIAMSNGTVLIYHEYAFADAEIFLDTLRQALAPAVLTAVQVTEEALPLDEAVSSYLFNSQLLTLSDGSMCIVAPEECRRSVAAKRLLDRWVAASDIPISAVHYLDVRESMQNGGGPACLRLRVVMPEASLVSLPPSLAFSDELHAVLSSWVETHYRESLTPDDLRDAALADEIQVALAALETLLDMPGLYADFSVSAP